MQAGLDLVAVAEAFNRPRAVLGLRQVPVRIGIATGSVSIGNVGTYRRMDFTAIGRSVAEAQKRAYEAVDLIDWPEGFCRRDIGWRAVGRG